MSKRAFLLCLLCIAALNTATTQAANFSEDFETRPQAGYPWALGAVSNGFGGWNFSSGSLQNINSLSVSGNQSISFTSASATAVLTHASPAIANGGGGLFLIAT